MPYIGQSPATGEANSFKTLDDITSYTLTFDGSSASVVSVANDTITEREHRFVTGQRVTYNRGGGTVITGLSDGVYYIIVEDRHTIKLATSANNAASGTAVNLTGLGVGASHTLNVAFDGVNTKFKATVNNGTKADITNAPQLMLSINGVLQQPHNDTTSPTTGYAVDHTSTIIFSAAPAANDQFFGSLVASNFATFDISDNLVDNFTGNGSATDFTLSKSPPNNESILVTIDGVVQYPDDTSAVRAYSVSENILSFVAAPGNGVEIQVRHIGFAGASSAGITGFYGRTGNAVLKNTDNIVFNDATASGDIQAANVTVTGNLTVNGTTTTLDTALTEVDKLEVGANNTTAGVAITQSGSGEALTVQGGNTGIGTDNARFTLEVGAVGAASTQLWVNGDARITGILSVGQGTITLDPAQNMLKLGATTMHQDGSTGDTILMRSGAYNPFRASKFLIDATEVIDNSRVGKNFSKIGIGTDNPTTTLQINHTSPKIILKDNDNAADISIHNVGGSSVYSAATDIVFQTANTSEKVRITAAGHLGLGANNNSSYDSIGQNFLIANESSHAGMTIRSGGSGAFGAIHFADGVSNNSEKRAGRILYSHDDDFMSFHTANTERLRIQSDGYLWLDKGNPGGSSNIVLDKADAGGATVRYYNAGTQKAYTQLGNDEHFYYYSAASVDQIWWTVGSAKMVLKPDGTLVVGHTAATTSGASNNAKFNVVGNIGSSTGEGQINLWRRGAPAANNVLGQINLCGGSAGDPGAVIKGEADAAWDQGGDTTDHPSRLTFWTVPDNSSVPAERLRITSAGAVVIGTDTAASNSELTIRAASPHLSLYATPGQDSRLNMGDTDDHDIGLIAYANSDNSMRFTTNATERLRITSTGKIGVGVAPAGWDSATSSSVIQVGSSAIFDYSSAQLDVGHNYYYDGSNYRFTTTGYASRITQHRGDGSIRFWSLGTGSAAAAASLEERVRITAPGNLFVAGAGGMNTTELPNGHTININGNSSNDGFSVIRYNSGYGAYGLNIGRSKSSTVGTNAAVTNGNDLGHITFYGADGTDFNQAAMITAQVDGDPSDGADMPGRLIFKTSPNGSATPTERLRIQNDGKVSIGGITAYTAFEVKGHSTNWNDAVYGMTLQGDRDISTGYAGSGILFAGEYKTSNTETTTFAYISGVKENTTSNNYAGSLRLGTRAAGGNPTEALRIDSGGYITTGGRASASHGSPKFLLWGSDPYFYFGSTNSVNNSSNVGIKFAVAGGSTGDYSKAGIFAKRMASYNDLDILFCFNSANDATGVSTAGEMARIRNTGKLYLGPYKSAGQYGTVSQNIPYKIGVSPYGWANGGDIAEISMGAHLGTGQDDGEIVFKTASDVHSSNTGLVERFRVTAFGGVTFNGDTAAANALDDYEEGTWTPVITSNGTNPSYSVSNNYSYYIKIGRLVHFNVDLYANITSQGSGGSIYVSIPFAVDTSSGNKMENYVGGMGGRAQTAIALSRQEIGWYYASSVMYMMHQNKDTYNESGTISTADLRTGSVRLNLGGWFYAAS